MGAWRKRQKDRERLQSIHSIFCLFLLSHFPSALSPLAPQPRGSISLGPAPCGRTVFSREVIELMNKSLQNFGRLVLFCIKANFCDQILIFQHFSRSTRFANLCTAQISKFQEKRVQNFARMKLNFISFLFLQLVLWDESAGRNRSALLQVKCSRVSGQK